MMKTKLLAFSRDPELVRQLEMFIENGEELSVTFVTTVEELEDITDRMNFDTVLIDQPDSFTALEELTSKLTVLQPDLKILILKQDNIDELPSDDIVYHSLLDKPNNPEDLATALGDLLLKSELVKNAPTEIDEMETVQEPEPSLLEIIDAADFESSTNATLQGSGPSPSDEKQSLMSILEDQQDGDNSNFDLNEYITPTSVSELFISYHCVLVPRHPRQYLARELADSAASILPRIHLSRGWRITGISVRPQYMLWTFSLPVETSPVEAIQEIRQRTTSYFFDRFPELSPTQGGNDFWAPGYLMMSGSQPLSPEFIREFVKRAHNHLNPGE